MANRFLTDVLPRALVEAQTMRDGFEREKMSISMQLGADEQWASHNCNCEYCDSQSHVRLSPTDREELEVDFDELDMGIDNLDRDIKSMLDYKKRMTKVSA